MEQSPNPLPERPGRYVPIVGPRLRFLLFVVFAGVAVLGATGAYLAAITAMNAADDEKTYTTPFTFWVFLVHVGVGVLFFAPFVLFGAGHYASSRRRTNRAAIRRGLFVFAAGLLV